MALRSVITLTTAPAGSGKSYVRCARFMVDDFLASSEGRHISNFPLGVVPVHHSHPPTREGETFAERIAEAVAKKRKCDVAEVLSRIESIPDQVLDAWREGRSGPWEYFRDVDLAGAHIAIDEIHVYCGKMTPRPIKGQWQRWLGEIRHRGATVELISQHEEKVAAELVNEAGLKLEVVKKDDERDPFMGIALGDWYELRAKFLTGEYTSCVAEIEKRDVAGKWKENRVRRWWMTPDYFRFYDSFSAPQSGSGAGAGAPLKEFQKRSALGLLRWFVLRNLGPILGRGLMAAAVVWLCSGGLSTLLGALTGSLKSVSKANSVVGQVAPSATASGTVGRSVPVRAGGVPGAPGGPVGAESGEVARLRGELVAMEQRANELAERARAGFGVALLTESEVTFRGGYTYGVGQVIDFGPYEGSSVERIDFFRRAVRLSDGTWLRMASSLDSGVAPVGDVVPLGPGTAGLAGRKTGTNVR